MTKDSLAARRGLDHTVYQPAEDSALLARAVTPAISSTDTVLEVGTGSGYVAEYISEETGATVVGVDLNPHACQQTAERGIPVFQGNLVDAVGDHRIDVLVSNPPYLPRDPGPDRDDWLSMAVVGGETGRELVTALLNDIDRILAPSGRAFLLLSSLMDIDAVLRRIHEEGFTTEEVARDDSFPFEVLAVYCLTRQDSRASATSD